MSDTGKQDQQPTASASDSRGPTEAIDDDQLPEDLRPSDDNPLAQPLDPEDESTKDPEELDLRGGKPAEERDDSGPDTGG